MSETKETPGKYGLVELATGKYFDKKMNKNLILKNTFVEASGDEFQKKLVAMVFYFYEGGKGRLATAQEFVEYGEENLEIVELDKDKNKDDAIEAESKVLKDGPVPLISGENVGGIVEGANKPDNVPAFLPPGEIDFDPAKEAMIQDVARQMGVPPEKIR